MDEPMKNGKKTATATFAGGCFWCMQPPFRQLDGVIDVVSGYAGGVKANPSYEEVSSGRTGHLESVQVTYDPEKISYDTLLDTFWKQIDPTDPIGQFADKGSQYRTAIFYHDDEQKRLAEASKKGLEASGTFAKHVMTEIRPFTNFFPAEEYHQDYDQKNPDRYHQYKVLSGREPFIEKTWGVGTRENVSADREPRDRARVVKVFSTPTCTGCRAVEEFLRSRNVEFTEIDMAADERARTYVIEKTGHLSSPIVQNGDVFIIGYDRKKMEKALA